MPDPLTAAPTVGDTVEYALQCVLAARQDLTQVAAGDHAALTRLTVALEDATAKLYDARRAQDAAPPARSA